MYTFYIRHNIDAIVDDIVVYVLCNVIGCPRLFSFNDACYDFIMLLKVVIKLHHWYIVANSWCTNNSV